MVTIHVLENGVVRQAERVEPAWLGPSATVTVWVDLAQPTDAELALLVDPFAFHPLSVDDARSAVQFPKIEQYPGYLYVILHDLQMGADKQHLATRDVDFFVGHSYLVTVHDGSSVALSQTRNACSRYDRLMADGPVGLLHRIVDAIVDHYRPVMDDLETRIDQMEEEAYGGRESLVRRVIRLRHQLNAVRQSANNHNRPLSLAARTARHERASTCHGVTARGSARTFQTRTVQ